MDAEEIELNKTHTQQCNADLKTQFIYQFYLIL